MNMILGNMKFTREEMTGKISDLSNGSKAKLILTKLVLEKCDVLLLDEPTRNVSPLSNPVIRKALKEYSGCIISVSHDRKYIEEVIDTVYVLTKEELKKCEFEIEEFILSHSSKNGDIDKLHNEYNAILQHF